MDDGTARRGVGGRQHIPRPTDWQAGGAAPWLAVSDGAPLHLRPLLAAVAERADGALVPPLPGARPSAVLVLLHEGADGVEMLFTRRSMRLREHRGEVSFPGGRLDVGESPVAGALREAHEEVGLDTALVDVHGSLHALSTMVSRSHIVPVVGSIDARPTLVASTGEVDRIFWVRLDDLAAGETFREERWGTPPGDRPVFFFEIAGETIWGATARIVHHVLRLAHGVDGPEPVAW